MAKIIEEEPLRGSGPFGGQMQRISTFRRLTPQVRRKIELFHPNHTFYSFANLSSPCRLLWLSSKT